LHHHDVPGASDLVGGWWLAAAQQRCEARALAMFLPSCGVKLAAVYVSMLDSHTLVY